MTKENWIGIFDKTEGDEAYKRIFAQLGIEEVIEIKQGAPQDKANRKKQL